MSCKWNVDDGTCAQIVDKLIAAGADVDAKVPRQGTTPLHIAAQRGRRQAIQRLIRAGADVNARNNEGKTALTMAREQERTEIVELLGRHGALESAPSAPADSESAGLPRGAAATAAARI